MMGIKPFRCFNVSENFLRRAFGADGKSAAPPAKGTCGANADSALFD
jgi:hypothetical protein